MEWFADNYLEENKSAAVLDIGSYDVNGNYKEIFTRRGHRYTGLDMESGPNVDIVPKQTYNWEEIKEDNYDVVISGQALEHIEFFWITVSEMTRVTKKGGLICIIAPNGFEEHRYPVDCWRFFTDGMIALARLYKLEVLHAHTNCSPKPGNKEWYSESCADSMIIMKKTYSGTTDIIDLKNYRCIPSNHHGVRGEMITHEEYLEKEKEKNFSTNKNKQRHHEDTKQSMPRVRLKRRIISKISGKLRAIKDIWLNKV